MVPDRDRGPARRVGPCTGSRLAARILASGTPRRRSKHVIPLSIVICLALLPWSPIIAFQALSGASCHCRMADAECGMACSRRPAQEPPGDYAHKDSPAGCSGHGSSEAGVVKLRCGLDGRLDVENATDPPRLRAGAPDDGLPACSQCSSAPTHERQPLPIQQPPHPPPRSAAA